MEYLLSWHFEQKELCGRNCKFAEFVVLLARQNSKGDTNGSVIENGVNVEKYYL
jgi:hypothetical protein